MLRIVFIKDIDEKRYIRKREPNASTYIEFIEDKDLPLEAFVDILREGDLDFYIDILKSGPGGYTGNLYDVTDWNEKIYILGSPITHMRGLREKDNKKITVNKKEFIALLELLLE